MQFLISLWIVLDHHIQRQLSWTCMKAECISRQDWGWTKQLLTNIFRLWDLDISIPSNSYIMWPRCLIMCTPRLLLNSLSPFISLRTTMLWKKKKLLNPIFTLPHQPHVLEEEGLWGMTETSREPKHLQDQRWLKEDQLVGEIKNFLMPLVQHLFSYTWSTWNSTIFYSSVNTYVPCWNEGFYIFWALLGIKKKLHEQKSEQLH